MTETVVTRLHNLNIETEGTEEEALEGIVIALRIGIEGGGGVDREVNDGGDGTQRALGAL